MRFISKIVLSRFPLSIAFLFILHLALPAFATDSPAHSFCIGAKDFLLDGRRFQIRCGEIHLERIPREYWRNRLRLCKAMGLNTVCAYLFWNSHEWEQGKFDWSNERDATEFCREAQEEGLWVILRPGPYSCAEWEMGGLPWWLLKNNQIQLRTRDPMFMRASHDWLKEVGRVLSPMQVTRGGPILMVQVENEYGFYGSDVDYIHEMRQATLDAGFKVPLFQCNPPSTLRNGLDKSLFQVVNFAKDPENAFKALREVQATGPLMCGEFYPGWFDTWGYPHHLGDTDTYLKDLEYMLRSNASFSIYMADGGTSFGMWAGADTPFKPDTSSYDYDAPISEAGWCGEKFNKTRALMHRYLLPGEVASAPDKAVESIAIPPFRLSETANVFDNLPLPVGAKQPDTMECYDQGRGCILYRTELKPGAEVTLSVGAVHDFAWIFLDGKQVGVMDRRSRRFAVRLPHRARAVQLDILVEAMGRVNFGKEVHDRKGVHGPIKIATADGVVKELLDWKVFNLPLDGQQLSNLSWKNAYLPAAPAFWRGKFDLDKAGDTFLDLRSLGKGVLWVNGHCIARFWNIGPTQTAYVPGVWLKSGRNEVIVLDLIGPQNLSLAGLKSPILDQLRPELDFSDAQKANGILQLAMKNPVLTAKFDDDSKAQLAHLPEPTRGRQFGLEILSEYGDAAAAVAELDLLDATGQNIPHGQWTIAYVDSEEKLKEDGSAINAINGQVSDCWRSKQGKSHYLVIDLDSDQEIGAFKYTPSSSAPISRIESFRLYVGNDLVAPRLP